MIKNQITLALLIICSFIDIHSQIRVKELPSYNFSTIAEEFLISNDLRQILPLNANWTVYSDNSRENSVQVNLPCAFVDGNDLIFEKEFLINDQIIKNKSLVLRLLGVNYSAEILLNDVIVFKNDVANIPCSVPLTRDLLKSSEPNNLKILVHHQLDDNKTIPPLQRFLFPENYGGITRDAFIEVLPNNRINLQNIDITLSKDSQEATISLSTVIESVTTNNEDSTHLNWNLSYLLYDNQKNSVASGRAELGRNITKSQEISFSIKNPKLWSYDSPDTYSLEISLLSSGEEIDKTVNSVAVKSIEVNEESLIVNNKKFHLKGVTYIPSNEFRLNSSVYSFIADDLKSIKELGFNAIRFAKEIPHPYALEQCEKLGLLAFIEIPIHSLPENFAGNENYQYRAITLLNNFLEEFKDFPAVAGIGVGTSFIPSSDIHSRLIASLAQRIKTKTNNLSYASFIGNNLHKIDNLDLYGVELFQDDPYQSLADFNAIEQRIGKNRLFISEATYPNYYGSGSGYSHKFSTEAQAKYFEDVINFAEGNKMSGFFINTLKNYIGDYSSFYSKYSENNSYNIGLTGDPENPTTIPNKVISSKLKGTERVTIPIGSDKDDSPIFIIFTGLILAILMAILINSKKKFREDSTRALLRPYNFYSDIRDQRIISGFHTIALMFILAGSHALLLTNLFYYVKNNILFEKILLAFANQTVMETASYLAWHPVSAFIYTFIFSILLFLLLALLIKVASFFVKTKVHYLNIYFVVIWAFLPMAILLPVKLILYRVLLADIINIYIYAFLVVYFIWILQRIIKGIYVIFDTSRTAVYFYSIVILSLIFGSMLLLSQLYDSSIYYILTALKQFQII